MAWSPPNLHTIVRRWACIQDMLKVKVEVKGHVIWVFLWFHGNCFFLQANGWIATKLADDGPQVGLHPGYPLGQGQGQRSCNMGTCVMSLKLLLYAGKSISQSVSQSASQPASQSINQAFISGNEAHKHTLHTQQKRYAHTYTQTNYKQLQTTNLLIIDGLQVSLHPGCAQGQGRGQWSCDTGTFVISKKNKIASSPRQMVGSWPNSLLH